MGNHFLVEQHGKFIKIKKQSKLPFYYYCIYVDHFLSATYYQGQTFYLDTTNKRPRQMVIVAFYLNNGIPTSVVEPYFLTNFDNRPEPDRSFLPGDILVASDNVNQVMTGYMGHSAIVVDQENLIEAPGGHPALRKDSIQQFLDKHPQHAHFRPKSEKTGQDAAMYAEEYLAQYHQNLEEGKEKPVFSFKLNQSIDDPWEYIYCSKLVYLSYTKGAGYEMKNDYLWYSPEDLYTNLSENNEFNLIYEHEDVTFHLNT